MKAIVAVADDWGIGRQNQLLFKIPKDMKHFRETTTGATVVMGHSTLRSFPGEKPLPKRTNIVLSRNKSLEIEGATVVNSIAELGKALDSGEDVFLIGGASIYSQLIDYCAEAIVTKVQASAESDCFFPNLDLREGWSLAESSQPVEDSGLVFTINRYVNENIKKL